MKIRYVYVVYIHVYIVHVTSLSSVGSALHNVGGVKCQPFLKQQPLDMGTNKDFQGKQGLPVS